MTADDLTDADREYARRWAAARGKRPEPRNGGYYAWTKGGNVYGRRCDLPYSIGGVLPESYGLAVANYRSEPAAWDALALKRVREDVSIPGGDGR